MRIRLWPAVGGKHDLHKCQVGALGMLRSVILNCVHRCVGNPAEPAACFDSSGGQLC